MLYQYFSPNYQKVHDSHKKQPLLKGRLIESILLRENELAALFWWFLLNNHTCHFWALALICVLFPASGIFYVYVNVVSFVGVEYDFEHTEIHLVIKCIVGVIEFLVIQWWFIQHNQNSKIQIIIDKKIPTSRQKKSQNGKLGKWKSYHHRQKIQNEIFYN